MPTEKKEEMRQQNEQEVTCQNPPLLRVWKEAGKTLHILEVLLNKQREREIMNRKR